MSMGRVLRRLLLTAHIIASVGWLGAVAAFFALAVAGVRSGDAQIVRGLDAGLGLLGRALILPLCLASLATGVAQALATPWGLFRHYWVVVKLGITVVSTGILLLHLQPIDHLAAGATAPAFTVAADLPVRVKLVTASGAAVLALLLTTVLSVYKPKGLTPYGRRLWSRRLQRASAGREGV